MKPRQLSWKWLLLGLVVLLIAGLAVLPRQIGTSLELRDRVAAELSAWTGGTVTLTEPLKVRYYPPLTMRGGFVLSNATKLPLVESVTARDVRFNPEDVHVEAGRFAVVTFTNEDAIFHDWSVEGLENVDVPARPGQTAKLRFLVDEPGTYEVICTVAGHAEAGMRGTLVVEP